MDNQEYLLGTLAADIKNLSEAVRVFSKDMRDLKFQLEGIKIWKAQIIGASATISVIASILAAAAIQAIKSWAR